MPIVQTKYFQAKNHLGGRRVFISFHTAMSMQNSAKEVVIINAVSLSYRYATVKCKVQILTQPKFHSNSLKPSEPL